ncbi:unnamed protein product [Heterobilharzia americana]|nr:unnamed protein product [Heterobilharzia americana]CAH8561349.1 unnamed protein product [Heterobilharzia americana]
MSNILEHVCTIFTVNTPGFQCFLKIFLDARGLKKESLDAYLNSKREIVVNAKTKTEKSDEIICREVQNTLTVPLNVIVENSNIVLLRNGFLLINIPYMSENLTEQKNETHTDESDRTESNGCRKYVTNENYIILRNNEKSQSNQLDQHQTIRKGNRLVLMIPLDQNYKEENVKVTVVQRSVCVTATYLDYPTEKYNVNGSDLKHMVQRTYYKEYEASDCIPDPDSITFHMDNNCLIVNLNIIQRSPLPEVT